MAVGYLTLGRTRDVFTVARTMEAILTLLVLFGGCFLALAVGAVYFVRSDSRAAMILRVGSSAYAPSIAVVFVIAELLWPAEPYTHLTQPHQEESCAGGCR